MDYVVFCLGKMNFHIIVINYDFPFPTLYVYSFQVKRYNR